MQRPLFGFLSCGFSLSRHHRNGLIERRSGIKPELHLGAKVGAMGRSLASESTQKRSRWRRSLLACRGQQQGGQP